MNNLTLAQEWNGRLNRLFANERAAAAEFLSTLLEFDNQRLWEPLGYNGLFRYLHTELRMSKTLAFYRKAAVDLIRRCPAVLEPLRDGRLCMSALPEVARALEVSDWQSALPQFFGRSHREAQAVAATLRPMEHPPLRTFISRAKSVHALEPDNVFPANRADEASMRSDSLLLSSTLRTPVMLPGVGPSAEPPPAPLRQRDAQVPLTATLHRIHFTASEAFVRQLETTKDVLARRFPDGNLESLFGAGLELLLAQASKSRRTGVSQPVKRAVLQRDQRQCQWPLAQGGTCGDTRFLEFDHVTPKARGGDASPGNLRLLCRRHNVQAAREAFGEEWMAQFGQRKIAANG
ncbi:MAG: HNH endonuclease [Myxococcaceae bacterium]